jgi:hypothetical protein
MCDAFVSFRFSETFPLAQGIKEKMEEQGYSVFVCAVPVGEDIAAQIATKLATCTIAIILGSETYSQKTESPFSTYDELEYILSEHKPFFLIKTCDTFKEHYAKVFLPSTISYYPLLIDPKNPGFVPADLIPQIIAKLNNPGLTGQMAALTTEETPVALPHLPPLTMDTAFSYAQRLRLVVPGNQVAFLQVCETIGKLELDYENVSIAEKLGNHGACEIVVKAMNAWSAAWDAPEVGKVLRSMDCLALPASNTVALGNAGACELVTGELRKWGKTNQQVAENGCGAIWNLAFNDANNKVKLSAAGACEAVTGALQAWGKTNQLVAENGCAAIWCLAGNANNKVKLGAAGAERAVNEAVANPIKDRALKALR